MTEESVGQCPGCGADLPQGEQDCPQCNAALQFCQKRHCQRIYLLTEPACPHCQAANPQQIKSAPPAADPAPAAKTNPRPAEPAGAPAPEKKSPAPDSAATAAGAEEAAAAVKASAEPLKPAASAVSSDIAKGLESLFEAAAKLSLDGQAVTGSASGRKKQTAAKQKEQPAEDGTEKDISTLLAATAQGVAPGAQGSSQLPQRPAARGVGPARTTRQRPSPINLSVPGTEPVSIEFDLSPPQRGKRGLVLLRVSGTGIEDEVSVTLTCKAACLGKEIVLNTSLQPTQFHTFPAIGFEPHFCGMDHLEMRLILHDRNGVPLGCWTTGHSFSVADVDRDVAQSFRAGGDIVIMPGAHANVEKVARQQVAHMASAATDGAAPLKGWQWCELQEDLHVRKQIQNACPPTAELPLGVTQAIDAVTNLHFHGLLQLKNPQARLDQCIGVTVGRFARFGRGAQDVDWWIKPVGVDVAQMIALSRQHFDIKIVHGRAWLIDRSSKGTWHNQTRVTVNQPVLLADGDQIEAARLLAFTVRLSTADGAVRGVWLFRSDVAYSQLCYLLLDNSVPVNMPADVDLPELWLAFELDARCVVFNARAADLGRVDIPPGESVMLDASRQVSWSTPVHALEQDKYWVP